ncbi:O-methyltransferase [Acetivibrio straminisolvens]|jgi:predicted O-methyltransferase YrrM|uniref:tRNA 5-hydroxyuridine methyltransferase n=1 Tax=Acetivibrio straminisolvens JCM 21531 TaxID=1294263 RepID=W4V2Z2_9FIRM|nr:O-methyltransferase [Acetivibrio straminisolvens]GAE87482.1 O-methyltransferase family protein [Acetivibrio straminisolvens JCM 21531]
MISYEYINDYIRNTIKKNDGLLAELEVFAKENHVPIVHPEVASLLKVIGLTLKPSRILEVGTAIGYSAILFSTVLSPGGRIDTIDRYELMLERARENIEKAGLKEVINIIEGDALDVLKCLEHKYDMIFLDAAKGQYPEFLPECLRLLRSGGLLISDNILYKGMVATDELVVRRKKTIVKRLRTYLKTICSMDELETSILPVGDGVAISFKK